MIKELQYPFDPEWILKKKKSLRNALLSDAQTKYTDIRIAVLGGQTTQNITLMLELFLLNNGIRPTFYESEYNKFYEDSVFDNPELEQFAPDVVYLCTCIRNITDFPKPSDSSEIVSQKENALLNRFKNVWESLKRRYNCIVIQNNFEMPYFRLMGNYDCVDERGRVNYVNRLNMEFAKYAASDDKFHICDVNYISASYGLEKWSDPFYWHMYKYAVSVPAIPYLSFNVANIIKSLYGRNKKAFNLDLDNTLWGGIVGDDGAENIEIGQETPMAQIYSEFQEYLKLHKEIGVLLTVNSKNDKENALAGLNRPDSVLKPDDFVDIAANWEPKCDNLRTTAKKLNLLPESFVFTDDNPAERAIIADSFANTPTPQLDGVEHYLNVIDKSGFFEVTGLSQDDYKRNEMYRENAMRSEFESSFTDYGEYLKSLEMKGEIDAFAPVFMARIAQLTNKSNQFNLTTKRYSQAEIESDAANPDRITLYGKLTDRFGDNGVVSVVIGRIENGEKPVCHMDLWLMSCRVLKRNMEYAMMDSLVGECKKRKIGTIIGYYYKTAKNNMVRDFYGLMGFKKMSEDESGNSVWKFDIPAEYVNKQDVIEICQRLP